MYEDELKHLSEKMDKSIQALRNEFTSIRTGQASPSLLDRVFVDYYGSKTPVTQVASVTVPEARMLVVQPWDKGILKDIEKAINISDRWEYPSPWLLLALSRSLLAIQKISAWQFRYQPHEQRIV